MPALMLGTSAGFPATDWTPATKRKKAVNVQETILVLATKEPAGLTNGAL
jgi:hypothetical protein